MTVRKSSSDCGGGETPRSSLCFLCNNKTSSMAREFTAAEMAGSVTKNRPAPLQGKRIENLVSLLLQPLASARKPSPLRELIGSVSGESGLKNSPEGVRVRSLSGGRRCFLRLTGAAGLCQQKSDCPPRTSRPHKERQVSQGDVK